eukprot:1105942-Pelagomonas_calceolata.AAC.3
MQRKPIPGAEDPERLAAFTHPSYELFFLHHPVEDLGVPDSKEGLHALIDDLVTRMEQGACARAVRAHPSVLCTEPLSWDLTPCYRHKGFLWIPMCQFLHGMTLVLALSYCLEVRS